MILIHLFNRLILFVATVLLLAACGQSVSEVTINPSNPAPAPDPYIPEVFITNSDTQGGSATISGSTNRFLSIQSFGGTHLRTSSSSASFRLTSGVGVD